MPATRNTSVRITCFGTMRVQARQALALEHGLQLVRRPGQQHDGGSDSSTHWPGAVPRSLGRISAPSMTNACRLLTSAILRLAWREALLELVGDLGVEDQLAVERQGHGLARHVVFGGPQAAGKNYDLGARHGAAHRIGQAVAIVADHALGRPPRRPGCSARR